MKAAPRMIRPAYFRLQGFRLRENQSNQWTRFSVPLNDLPLLGFHLLMASTHGRRRGRHLVTVTLRNRQTVARSDSSAFHGMLLPRAASPSREKPSIPRFLAFGCLLHFDDSSVRAYAAAAVYLGPSYPSPGREDLFVPKEPPPSQHHC